MGGMDTDQLYSVRWNEFHASIITSFRHLLDQEDFIDVTIACDGHSFTAHKVVLSACSPYFRSLLKANPCQHPIVILRDVKKQEMEALLSFMYNGEVRINQEHLPEFLKTARSLQVRGLVDFTKENQPSSWGSSTVVPVDIVGKTKATDINLSSPPYKRQRNNSEQMTNQPMTPSSNYNSERDKDTPSLLVQALELNQSQSSQNKNAVDSSADRGSSSDEEDSNSGESDGSHTVNENTRSEINQQNNDISIQPQISQAQHTKLENVDFLSSSGNNHDLHNTSISIEQQSRHSFPASISSGVSIISSLQGIPGLLPGPSGIHNSSQENNYARRSIEMNNRVRATDPRPCPKCGKIYRSAHTLRTHLEDKHTICSGYRCVLCGTVAKSRNSLHSHMSRQHRGISTKDLPVQPMPSNFDPELASNLLLKAGVKISPAELRARASPTDAVTTGGVHRRGDVKLDLQSANSSVCGGDDPEDLTINSIHAQQQQQQHQLQQHLQQQHSNNNLLRYGPADVQLLHNKFPTAMELIDNYARSGGGGGGGTGGALSPFLPSFTKDHFPPSGGADKMSPYNNKAFLDSYLKALVETTNPPLFKMAGDIIKHDEIAADDAEYTSGSEEEEEDDEEDSVNNSPLPLQASKN
ncbi:BTB/POZ domain,Zinc finger C2H2-type,SKP1/BTB/POZ domain [Cinara cedri]|uniref:BTB/POZ domain,Zinc finger C2H2-type,SKP1/BTB/POZ domain n=1 Tax=Cinara cedri TaxID=506608 RepID=A0A5E4NM71_9HEMI|nr:BTB/POZ domain,Zinc finger C2H2-type,SKP1/BTB/POZ domain [Cinara cedri]